MQLLRHFTIRRVVLWMMILSLAVVALAGSYGALTLREMYRHADRADVLTQQLTFLTRAGLVMQDGTAAVTRPGGRRVGKECTSCSGTRRTADA
nr:hypothetical protein [Pantoea sp. ME81]